MKKDIILSFILVAISLYSCSDHPKKQEISKEQVVNNKSKPPIFKDSVTNQGTSVGAFLCGNSICLDDEPIPTTIAENGIYLSVEQMPQFHGGNKVMMSYIKDNLKYPKIAIKDSIQGQVIVRFVVSKDGSVKDIQVLRSLEAACDKEAIRIVESMPKWIPGKQDGKVVDVYYVLPVRFRLEDAVKSNK